ncbi:DUF4278 domain-containing protein [Sodalinema gerasimenkoae]|uniref:DUF4278 domain-containing protein n=1 Tax=Sodalinema gerasimenkoae TaxID=2862348 RepID=UPI0013586987|nr:DUF4278 domain-containing protein [Sodalinema gerasimenkoae]
MQLTYRGITYKTSPVQVEAQAPTQVSGKYRGLDWRFCNVQPKLTQQPTVELKYRGVSYRTNEAGRAESVSEQSRRLMMNNTRRSERRHLSMLNRSFAELGA